jgi:phosphoglycolate phosphatase-like HAD superfamily hydrolase
VRTVPEKDRSGLATLLPSGAMRHVIWDWNGTLVDDLGVVVEAVNSSLAAVGGPIIDEDVYRNHYTRPVRLFYDRLLGRDVSDADWRRINAAFHTTYAASLDRVSLTHDAREAIAVVTAAGGSQSILSMWGHDDLVTEVDRRGLDRYMVRVDGNPDKGGDTKTRLLAHHLDKLPPNGGAVLIGDAIDDGRAALHLGVACVLYDGGSHHRPELEAVGVPVADTLVAAATIAVHLAG